MNLRRVPNNALDPLVFSLQVALLLGRTLAPAGAAGAAADDPLAWPPITRMQKPWTYWWWMGSAVDSNNIVNLDYRPFDASDWPLTDSGLLGPVTLTPVRPAWPVSGHGGAGG
jgi:hypothetical protein